MVKSLNIGRYEVTFVLRHRFEKCKDRGEYLILKSSTFRDWELGFFFRKDKCISCLTTDSKNIKLTSMRMFGINFLLGKCWVTITKNPLNFKVKNIRTF